MCIRDSTNSVAKRTWQLVSIAAEDGLLNKLDEDKQPSLNPGKHKIRIGFPLHVIEQMPDINIPPQPTEILTGYVYTKPVTITTEGGPEAGLDFLDSVPEFRDLNLEITEAQLLKHIQSHPLAFSLEEGNEGKDYHLWNRAGENVYVMFSKGECSGIQRMQKMDIVEFTPGEVVDETLPDTSDGVPSEPTSAPDATSNAIPATSKSDTENDALDQSSMWGDEADGVQVSLSKDCLLYTSPSPRDS